MHGSTEACIGRKFVSLRPVLDERSRRVWAAVEADSLGRGGISSVSRATGFSRTTIHAGMKELEASRSGQPVFGKAVRARGGGRKPVTEHHPTLLSDLEHLVAPLTRGDPESPLRWTCKSVRQLAAALVQKGHKIGRQKVADLLRQLGYSLQSNPLLSNKTLFHHL